MSQKEEWKIGDKVEISGTVFHGEQGVITVPAPGERKRPGMFLVLFPTIGDWWLPAHNLKHISVTVPE